MARHNLVFLTGAVINQPRFKINDEGETEYAICHLNVVRGFRDVGDNKRFMKSDDPTIMTRDPGVLKEMEFWKPNDIVQVKGVIAAKNIKKATRCTHCEAKNVADGALVYVNPIFVMTLAHCESSDDALNYLANIREISNQVYVLGTLCRDPGKVSPKEGLVITQYQIALNRKYFIRSDPPEVKSDYPWVKSYGKNAKEDKERLHVGSKVFIDGCLQARSIMKHTTCAECGQIYDWKDRAMEIVPYETEYVGNYYSDEEITERKQKEIASAMQDVFGTEKQTDIDDLF